MLRSCHKLVIILLLAILVGITNISYAKNPKYVKEMSLSRIVWDLDEKQNNQITPPELITFDLPEYPESARSKELTGKVWLAVTVSKTGRATGIIVCESSGSKSLDQAATKVAASLRFNPATKDGLPVTSKSSYIVDFIDSDDQSLKTTDSDKMRVNVKLYQDKEVTYLTTPEILFYPLGFVESNSDGMSDSSGTIAIKIKMNVSKEGFVKVVSLVESSGTDSLDRVAIKEAYNFQFNPLELCGERLNCTVTHTVKLNTKASGRVESDSWPKPDDFVAIDTPAELIIQMQPNYHGTEGLVWVQALVLKDGFVAKAQVAKSSGQPRLDAAAVDAALKNRFTPALLDGQPVATWVVYSVEFKKMKKP